MATGLEAGPIDPSDLSQRLSSLPLEGEEEEGESAPIFGASEGLLLIQWNSSNPDTNGCLISGIKNVLYTAHIFPILT